MGSRQGVGIFQTPCILAHPSICIFIQKYVLGAHCIQGAVLDAENKAMDDCININNKPHYIYGSCYGTVTALRDVFYTCQLI